MVAWRLSLALVCMSALVCAPARAQQQHEPRATEAALTATYLYKFLSYVEWPPGRFPLADTPLEIGVAGSEAVLAELQGLLASRRVSGRQVLARPITLADPLDRLHVLFVGAEARAPQYIERLAAAAVVVVTEGSGGLDAGAMLNFIAIDGRVRFEAAPAAAERAGLKLGARLLSVAERVLVK